MISFTPEDVFLVTGASSGLGRASALLLNKLGATVIATGRDIKKLQTARAESINPSCFHCEAKDIAANISELPAWVTELKNKYGKLRGLVYCSGIVQVIPLRIQEAESIKELYEINVFGAHQLCRGFFDRRNNTGAGAAVVLISSTAVMHGNKAMSAYASSKGAVIALAKSLAAEGAAQGIRVNSIAPDTITTPMTINSIPDLEEVAPAFPLGAGEPADIANAAAFLLSNAARWVTGQNLVVDGGKSLI